MNNDFLSNLINQHKPIIEINPLYELTKKCDLCGKICMEGEYVCPDCNAYRFISLKEKEEILSISVEV